MNSFEITHFFWIWYEFGLDSCFHEKPILQYGRVLIGIAVQILCSYSILPLYSLITQICFFRQFFSSVGRSDYLTMRHGFISVHLAPGNPSRFRLTKESSFVKGHATNFTGLPVFFYI
nr:MLO-like protein 9 [Tanacetum cinerariifolium]